MLSARVETVHEDRMQRDNVVGTFCGQPIITVDELGASADDLADLYTRLATSSHTSIPAGIMPGEERCTDGIIRRTTTAEAQTAKALKELKARWETCEIHLDLIEKQLGEKYGNWDITTEEKAGPLARWRVSAKVDSVPVLSETFAFSSEGEKEAIMLYRQIVSALFPTGGDNA